MIRLHWGISSLPCVSRGHQQSHFTCSFLLEHDMDMLPQAGMRMVHPSTLRLGLVLLEPSQNGHAASHRYNEKWAEHVNVNSCCKRSLRAAVIILS